MSGYRRAWAALVAALLWVGLGVAPALAAGATWTFTVASGSQEQDTQAIVCPGVHRCVAVGWQTVLPSGLYRPSIDVVTPQGSSHVVPGLPSDAQTDTRAHAVLTDVACSSVDSCVAVGSYYGTEGYDIPLLETWNGSEWVPRGLHLLRQSVKFNHVGCAGDFCAASGAASDGRPVLVSADAGVWQQVPIDDPSWPDITIVDVGCTGDAPCYAFASGYPGDGPAAALVIQSTTAGTAKITKLPSPPGANGVSPLVFSCYASGCAGLSGYANDDFGPTKIAAVTLADGHWTVAHLALPKTINSNPPLRLYDLSCNSLGSTCAAVGVYGRDDPELGDPYVGGLVLTRVDGTWRARNAPQAPSSKNWSPQLISVSCTTNDTCAASGYSRPDAHYTAGALVESYGDGRWTPRELRRPDGTPSDAYAFGGLIGCNTTFCVGSAGYATPDGGGGPAWIRTTNLAG